MHAFCPRHFHDSSPGRLLPTDRIRRSRVRADSGRGPRGRHTRQTPHAAQCEPPIYPHANDLKAIKKFCEERLMISYSDEEMEVAIVEIVNKNSSGSWRQQLSDYSHSFRTSITDLIFKMDV